MVTNMCDETSRFFDLLKIIFAGNYLGKSYKAFVDSKYKYSIGLIIQPGPQGAMSQCLQLFSNPVQLANWWGHTAIYVRYDGKIVNTMGYDPHRLRMFNVTNGIATIVSSGKGGTQGYNYDEDTMFRSPDMICIEFKVDKNLAYKFLKKLNKVKPGKAEDNDPLTTYVTRGGGYYSKQEEFNPKQMGNCIDFVNTILKRSSLKIKITDFDLEMPFNKNRAIEENKKLYPTQGRFTGALINKKISIQRKTQLENIVFRMPSSTQIPIRIRGAIHSISLGRVLFSLVNSVGTSALGIESYVTCTNFEILTTVVFILDFLMETIPSDSIFWSFQPRYIEAIIELFSKIALVPVLYSGDIYSMWPMLLSLLCLFVPFFA